MPLAIHLGFPQHFHRFRMWEWGCAGGGRDDSLCRLSSPVSQECRVSLVDSCSRETHYKGNQLRRPLLHQEISCVCLAELASSGLLNCLMIKIFYLLFFFNSKRGSLYVV